MQEGKRKAASEGTDSREAAAVAEQAEPPQPAAASGGQGPTRALRRRMQQEQREQALELAAKRDRHQNILRCVARLAAAWTMQFMH